MTILSYTIGGFGQFIFSIVCLIHYMGFYGGTPDSRARFKMSLLKSAGVNVYAGAKEHMETYGNEDHWTCRIIKDLNSKKSVENQVSSYVSHSLDDDNDDEEFTPSFPKMSNSRPTKSDTKYDHKRSSEKMIGSCIPRGDTVIVRDQNGNQLFMEYGTLVGYTSTSVTVKTRNGVFVTKNERGHTIDQRYS